MSEITSVIENLLGITAIQDPSGKIENFQLFANYPNPFNPATTIEFYLPPEITTGAFSVKLSIYNASGQEVIRLVNGALPAGRHRVQWNGTDSEGRLLSSGVYLYRLTVREPGEARRVLFTQTRRMLLLR